MQITADIVAGHERRESAVQGGLDLARPLSQFGCDPAQAEAAVDVLFLSGGYVIVVDA
jgi:hypothetical protein